MFLLILAFLIILAIDLPPLIREKHKHDLIIYGILMLIGEAMTKMGLTY